MLPRGTGYTVYSRDVSPYWKAPHDVIRARLLRQPLPYDPTAHLVEQFDVVCGSQLTKTFGYMVPVLGFIAACCPRDLAVILPSHDDAKQFARNKLDGCFRNSPRLMDLLPRGAESQARRLGTKAWLLDRMTMYYLNGSVAMQLRQRDIPVILMSEFDALPANVQKQGSPLKLANERQKTFPAEMLTLRDTTPTTTSGHGWQSLQAGDHQRLLIACDRCGHHQFLDPDRLEVTNPDASPEAIQIEDLAVWRCAKCGRRFHSDDVRLAVTRACEEPVFGPKGGYLPGWWECDADGIGHWAAHACYDLAGRAVTWGRPSGLHRSIWLNSMYSRSISLGRFARADRESATGNPNDRQTFVNNWRAEPWFARSDGLSSDAVGAITVRGVAGYQHGQCPTTPWRIVLGIDQQGQSIEQSWFPYVVRMFLQTGECFLIEAGKVDGFAGIDNLATKVWSVGGKPCLADVITIDCGNGAMVRFLRQWCAREPRRRFSLAGSGTMNAETSHNEIRL
jgi:DNA-directed RNA polymerase subunit RPC12/RpoP